MGVKGDENTPRIGDVIRGEIDTFAESARFANQINEWCTALELRYQAVFITDLDAPQMNEALLDVGVKNPKLRDQICKHSPGYSSPRRVPPVGNLQHAVQQAILQSSGRQGHTGGITSTAPNSGPTVPMWDGGTTTVVPQPVTMSSAPVSPVTPPARRRGNTPPARPNQHAHHHNQAPQQPHYNGHNYIPGNTPRGYGGQANHANNYFPQPKGFSPPPLQHLNNGGVFPYHHGFGGGGSPHLGGGGVGGVASPQARINFAKNIINAKMAQNALTSNPIAYPALGGLGGMGGCGGIGGFGGLGGGGTQEPIFVGGDGGNLGGANLGMLGGLGGMGGMGGAEPIYADGGMGGMGGMGFGGGCGGGGDLSPIFV